ncbi:hypothetical protein AB4225_14075 [Streptomyces sp. 2RAF24]|uniref:hypothetical protein n=1 Tax=Streptomyces sp. 2RAF24 TaxID=3232997 RepID=UPI003F966B35
MAARVLADFFDEVVLLEPCGALPGCGTARVTPGKAKVTYTSMNFDRPEEGHPDYFVAYEMLFAPRVARAGVLLAVEGGRWTCSLFGFQQQPPTDDAGYLEFAHTLDNPHLA